FLFCRDCGDSFHKYCFDLTLKIPPEKRNMWRCPACRICEVCKGEENWDEMLCCDECDRGFHIYCLRPPLKQIPAEGWRCSECVRCLSCGSKTPGPKGSDRWRKDYTLCSSCWVEYEKKNYCPICKVVTSSKDIKMVNCDSCQMWVHVTC
ncbi:hypothetical protein GUITHDRAFT_60438, partial [Guillardia theta CCMP2712]